MYADVLHRINEPCIGSLIPFIVIKIILIRNQKEGQKIESWDNHIANNVYSPGTNYFRFLHTSSSKIIFIPIQNQKIER